MSISDRSYAPLRERLRTLEKIEERVAACSLCPLHTQRKAPLAGRFLEPTDALLVNLAPHETEDEAGVLLAADRDKSFDKLFSLSQPSLDIHKLSYTTVYKCFGSGHSGLECLSFLDEQVRTLDPVLVITLGEEVTRAVTGRDLEVGKAYVTGEKDQHIVFPLMQLGYVVAKGHQKERIPQWISHLKTLAEVAQKYDFRIFK